MPIFWCFDEILQLEFISYLTVDVQFTCCNANSMFHGLLKIFHIINFTQQLPKNIFKITIQTNLTAKMASSCNNSFEPTTHQSNNQSIVLICCICKLHWSSCGCKEFNKETIYCHKFNCSGCGSFIEQLDKAKQGIISNYCIHCKEVKLFISEIDR